MNRKLNRMLEPKVRVYLVFLAVFAGITCYFQLRLGLVELGLVVVLLIYYLIVRNRRRKEMAKYITDVTNHIDAASKDTMVNSPLPMVIFQPDTGDIIWSNDRFLKITGDREHLFDTKIDAAVPGFSTKWLLDGKTECPTEYKIDSKSYMVFGHVSRSGEGNQTLLATTYWVDVTALAHVREQFYATKPVVSILLIDNYEDLIRSTSDKDRSSLRSAVEDEINTWLQPSGGLLCRYDRDRYLCVFEEQYLERFQQGKFSVLDAVHKVVSPNGVNATLSIGIGMDTSFGEMMEFASLAIEMALSRGGDQAVIKNRFNFEFYGGRTKETERHTKVKSRVMSNALNELLHSSSEVFVMGHHFADLDAVGASIGICAIARHKGIPAYIIEEPTYYPGSIMRKRVAQLPEYENRFITSQEAMLRLNNKSLLVVVDTNRPEQVIARDVLESAAKVAVIDHHLRAADYISNAALNFHEPYASSACELVTEMIQYLIEPSDLLRTEAEALLAGIVLDTKNFTLRTGGRTFEAAAFLRRRGADTTEVKKLFQNNLDDTIAKYDVLRMAKMVHGDIAVAAVPNQVSRVIAAQAADELLNVAGADASFVLYPDGDTVIISGRSVGEVNVQYILEMLGGGGNAAAAGAQVHNSTLQETLMRLLQAIDKYYES
ncbi:MAG: DHH family phosphoesterase [Clostridiales bacterium]|nr:DHH family phosphoesterase [Clostridiales bacterium]